MKEELRVVCQHYISDELISNFIESGIGNELKVEITTKKEEQKYYNFSGAEIADIILYFDEHTTELIVKGVLIKAAYDILKGGVKLLWNGLKNVIVKKVKAGSEPTDKPTSISLRLMANDKAIEIVLDGDISDDQIDKIIDQSFTYLQSDKLEDDIKNPDFLPRNEPKPRIRLVYNKETKTWEPKNFGEARRQMEEYQKWAEDNFKN
jgi:hypothetical protein